MPYSFRHDADNSIIVLVNDADGSEVLRLTAVEAERLIESLGLMRAATEPPVAPHYPLGQAADAIFDPRWATESDALQGNSLLHVRDPRFGWLHYVFPRQEAGRLAELLKNQSEAPDPTPQAGVGH